MQPKQANQAPHSSRRYPVMTAARKLSEKPTVIQRTAPTTTFMHVNNILGRRKENNL